MYGSDPMLPSTSRVATPGKPSSTLSARQVPASPFRAQSRNMEASISRVHAWQGNFIPQSPQQSQRPPSVISSTISNMTNTSKMTTFSALSVNTKYGQFDNWIQQSQSALMKLSHSSVENQDPMKSRERMTIPQIEQSLASYDMSVQVAAIRELEPLVKPKVVLEQTYCKSDLEKIIYALFEVLVPRPQENENMIRKVIEILHRAVVQKQVRRTEKIFHKLNSELMDRNSKHTFQVPRPYSIYELVIERASRLDTAYDQAAMLLLTQICCKPFFMKYVFSEDQSKDKQSANHQRLHKVVMKFAIKNLRRQETKKKSKGFCVSIIKNLSMRNEEIFNIAYKLGVIPTFCDIIKDQFSDEDLLWPTMQALAMFFSYKKVGEDFVELGGAQALCKLLSHGSSRLLHELLACMQRLSLLDGIKNQDMKDSICCVIQMVGSDDPTVAERATGVLRNIGHLNKLNKVIMVNRNVTNEAIAVLRTSNRYQFPHQTAEAAKKQISSIYENSLSILFNVTRMGEDDDIASALKACRMISENRDATDVLLYFINLGAQKCRKFAVAVMHQVIDKVPAFAERFVHLTGANQETLPILLLKRAYESLGVWQALEVMRTRKADEEMEDHEAIVCGSVGLLSILCRKGNPRFFEILQFQLTSINPFTSLFPQMSNRILLGWIDFILAICCTEWSLQNRLMYHFLMQDHTIQHTLPQYLHRPHPHPPMSPAVFDTYKNINIKINEIIEISKRQHQQYNEQQHMAMIHAQQQQQQYQMRR
ncbi:hypothetical protein B9Z55_007679 [Caenorhabditis nigoni]|uniref:Armadillo repeat-containing domain-containing protein n=2 Tax=Caenorhabditis nigoni TaxID=1611254 RepID=A0A2G5VB16_9PELO|nr:hypothetical protein B9Z55_007679 [Caenorhabditis nigoni]